MVATGFLKSLIRRTPYEMGYDRKLGTGRAVKAA